MVTGVSAGYHTRHACNDHSPPPAAWYICGPLQRLASPLLSMTTLSHYQRKFWYEDLLSGTINALSFSEDARLLAVADSRGVLVTFDTGMGSPIHVAYMTPKIQVFTLLWRGVDEVFFGLSNGAVGSACFRHVGNEVRQTISRTSQSSSSLTSIL